MYVEGNPKKNPRCLGVKLGEIGFVSYQSDRNTEQHKIRESPKTEIE